MGRMVTTVGKQGSGRHGTSANSTISKELLCVNLPSKNARLSAY